MIKIGTCGWSYLREHDFSSLIRKKYKTKLQAYAQLFDCVEINSTFYRIPKVRTAEKWLDEARDINKKFEFTVKASQLITHIGKFSGQAFWAFQQMKDICKALNAKILLLQSPASFGPSKENIEKMKIFFETIKRDDLILTWEPRGKWWQNPKTIKKICRDFDLINCVDPFRNNAQYFGKNGIAYFRLHGFGKPSMYNYDFSKSELKDLATKCKKIKAKKIYVMFNNVECYKNALNFKDILK